MKMGTLEALKEVYWDQKDPKEVIAKRYVKIDSNV